MNVKRKLIQEMQAATDALERAKRLVSETSITARRLADGRDVPAAQAQLAEAEAEETAAREELARCETFVKDIEERARAEKIRRRSLSPAELRLEQIADLEIECRDAGAVVARLRGDRETILIEGGNPSRLDDVDRRITEARRNHEVLDSRLAALRGQVPRSPEPGSKQSVRASA